MISIIDRYILREVIKSYLAILTVLLLIFTSNSFIKILQKAVSGTISNDVLFQLVALKSVDILGAVIPPAFFFAVLYAIGRMYRDSEMTALASCGFGFRRVFRSVTYAALPVSMFVALLTLVGMPWAEQISEQIYERQETEAEMGNAVAGRFNEFKSGKVLFFAEEMSSDKTKLKNVFVQNRQHGELGLVTASGGYQYVDEETGDRFMVLQDAHRYVGDPGESEYSVGEMEEFGMRISKKEKDAIVTERKALSTSFLLGSRKRLHKSELQHRFLLPLSVFVFSLAGVILSRSLPREGTQGRIVLAILFYTFFLNLQALSHTWMQDGVTPMWMGRWWVFIVSLLLIWLLYYLRSQQFGRFNKWLLQRIGR
ncbi:MAG: LPS export ABC transporter permease LptF [Gammaproteobacteria bacterium]|nr:LPS export ABC transporter permease LptF [Gammaproteobacteria bacterium]